MRERHPLRTIRLALAAGLIVLAGAVVGASSANGGTVTGSKSLSETSIACDGSVEVTISLTGTVPSAKVVLAIDRSGSMASSLGAVKTGMGQLIDGILLGNGTTVGVVTFGDPAVTAQGLTDSNAAAKAALPSSTSGNTNVASAISTAQALLGSEGRRFIVLASDGFATRPSSNPFGAATSAADAAKAAGIQIVTLGVPNTAGNVNANLATWASPGSSYTAKPASAANVGAAVNAIVDVLAPPAATGIVVTDTVSDQFSAGGLTSTKGNASVSSGVVSWSLPRLGHETVELRYTATHVGELGDLKLLSTVTYSDDQLRDADDVGLADSLVFVSCSTADAFVECVGAQCETSGSLLGGGLGVTSSASGVGGSAGSALAASSADQLFLVQRSLGDLAAPCAGFSSLIGAPVVEVYTTTGIPDALTVRFVLSKEVRKQYGIGVGHLRICLETNLPFKTADGTISKQVSTGPDRYAGLLPKTSTKTNVPGYGLIASPYFKANGLAGGEAEVVIFVRAPYDPRASCC